MRRSLTFLLCSLFSYGAFAQDTTALKRQANMVAKAFLTGNYSVIVDRTYPKALAQIGGKDKMLKLIEQTMSQMKAQGMTFEKAEVGSPGKFYRAGTEIHCLVPETLTIKMGNGKLVNHAHLLAITKDHGRFWYFLDLNKNSLQHIHQLLPNLNQDMIIPEPAQPTFYSN